ncbi:hypothetical protein F4803DRAFT_504655 [Xylaria telfairii]|nr:hypothetical protein F4803DRAFT_504655 [Xylaria telfairii]
MDLSSALMRCVVLTSCGTLRAAGPTSWTWAQVGPGLRSNSLKIEVMAITFVSSSAPSMLDGNKPPGTKLCGKGL